MWFTLGLNRRYCDAISVKLMFIPIKSISLFEGWPLQSQSTTNRFLDEFAPCLLNYYFLLFFSIILSSHAVYLYSKILIFRLYNLNVFTKKFILYNPKITKTHLCYYNWYEDKGWLSHYPHINCKAILEIVNWSTITWYYNSLPKWNFRKRYVKGMKSKE